LETSTSTPENLAATCATPSSTCFSSVTSILDPDGVTPQRPRGVLRTLDVGDGHARAFAQVTLSDGAADPAGGGR